jgi:hypothetical protein
VFVFGDDTLLLPGIVAIFFHIIAIPDPSVCAVIIFVPVQDVTSPSPMHFLHSSIADLAVVQVQHFHT